MNRKTHKINVDGETLGRVSVVIANLLRGKNKPDFAPHKDVGDFVLIQNIDKIRVTGRKASQKIYYRHSGYPGGLKQITYKELIKKDPTKVLRSSVMGMLPKNKLRSKMIRRLKIEKKD